MGKGSLVGARCCSPGSHYVVDLKSLKNSIAQIRNELSQHLRVLRQNNQLVEAQRLESATRYDLEQLEELGFCSGIENYSRYLTARNPGEAPPCLLTTFPPIGSSSSMRVTSVFHRFAGCIVETELKSTLIEHGFRLPSALDNRPLKSKSLKRCKTRLSTYLLRLVITN